MVRRSPAPAPRRHKVFGVASAGGYSQLALLDRPVAKPDGLSWEGAASVISVGEAAFRVLSTWG